MAQSLYQKVKSLNKKNADLNQMKSENQIKSEKNLPTRLTGKDILALGIPEGPKIRQALERSRELQLQKQSPLQIQNALQREFLKPEAPKLTLRENPLSISQAAHAQSPEEEKNLESAHKKMAELTLCPVIERAGLMPDTCPSGSEFGCIPVGGAIQTNNEVLPAAHSADVCCSMFATFFDSRHTPKEILDALEASTHFGPTDPPNPTWDPILEEPVWRNPFLQGLEGTAQKHLQTQGDGNHFASLGRIPSSRALAVQLDLEGYYNEAKKLKNNPDSPLWALVTHHGSRSLGAQIYKRGLLKAEEETKKIAKNIPKTLSWLTLDSEIGQAYWAALEYAQRWAKANHTLIHNATLKKLQITPRCQLGNEHNFVWKHQGKILHGKGATPAWKDSQGRRLLGIIPLNMAEGILLTFGSNNREFLSFSPHGAGRNLSRTETLKPFRDPTTQKLDPKKIQETLKSLTGHLDIRWGNRWGNRKSDLSESPLGYKNAQEVKAQLQHYGLARIALEIQPFGCLMAGEIDTPWKNKKKRNSPEIVR